MLPGTPRRHARRQHDRVDRRRTTGTVTGRRRRRRRHDADARSHHQPPAPGLLQVRASPSGDRPGKELPPGVMMAIGVRTCRVLLESGFTGYVRRRRAPTTSTRSSRWRSPRTSSPGPRIRACGHHIGTTGDMNNRGAVVEGATRRPASTSRADGPDELRDAGPRRDRPRRRDHQDLRQLRPRHPRTARPTQHVARRDRHDRRHRPRARRQGPRPRRRQGDDPRVHRARRRRHRPRRRDRRRDASRRWSRPAPSGCRASSTSGACSRSATPSSSA